MASSGTFATWDSRHYQGGSGSTATFSEGNCRVGTTSGGYPLQYSNFAFPATGKYYIELNNIVNNNYHVFGISRQINVRYGDGLLNQTGSYQYQAWNGQKRGNGGSAASYGSSWTSVGDVIGLAFDADNGKIWWSKNGTFQASGDPAAGSNEAFSGLDASETYYFGWSDYYTSKAGTVHINCGQDSSFSGSKTSGSANATDSNGFGDFYYTPPTGFLALCSANVPTSENIDPAETDDDYPAKNFNTVIWTGNQTDDRAVTGVGFKPDLVWLKQRASFSNPGILTDSSRGATKRIESYSAVAEATDSDGLKSFTSDGFTLGTNDKYNWTNTHTYVAWCWRANGGVTSSNTNGSITTTVQANTKAGFSIMTYTGTGSNATIGHGLSAKPDFILIKRRSSEQTWGVYHTSLGATKYLALNLNGTAGTDTAFWNDTEPTTSVITIGTEGRVNQNTGTYVAYAWHNVEGYQKFGSYTGNGNASGIFIHMGFRPRLFVTKKLGTDNWIVIDSGRETFNAVGEKVLLWDTNDTEFDPSNVNLDFVSNGVKMRNTDGKINANGTDYVYMAWGDVPFKYNNAF